MYSSGIHRFAKLVAGATFLLIIAGGLVTSTDSGLSVPDWPLSYGQVMPPMIGGIRFEHTHRLIAGAVGILTLLLMILLLKFEKRSWMKKLGILAFLAVVIQAVLGGLTVIYLLPLPVSVTHACLAQTFFCLVVAIAFFTSRGWHEDLAFGSEFTSKMRRLALLTFGFAYLQLVLGAVVRHTQGKHGIAFHIIGAALVLIHAVLVSTTATVHFHEQKKVRRPAFFLGSLVAVQVVLGLGAFILTRRPADPMGPRVVEVLFTTAHQAAGALILATAGFLSLRTLRNLTPVPKPLTTAPSL